MLRSLYLSGLFVLCMCSCGEQPATESAVESSKADREDPLLFGFPIPASERNIQLIKTPQFVVAFNNERSLPDWTAWHLSAEWKGYASRCNCFHTADTSPEVSPADAYRHSGYDRGHLCPSDDRDASAEDNAATFLMANIAPQVPELNRDTWEKLEHYCRRLVADGNELYIMAGTTGLEKPASGLPVPKTFWKMILVLPEGKNDAERTGPKTRIIAVNIPNRREVATYGWNHYRISVDELEQLTGLDLLASLPDSLEDFLEKTTDAGPVR